MTWLFLHFHWAFPTLQEFTGTEVPSTDGRAGGEGRKSEQPHAQLLLRGGGPSGQAAGRDGCVRQVALGMDSTPKLPKRQHLPASSFCPTSSHLQLGPFWWQYPVPCFIRIWCQVLVHPKIWNVKRQPGQWRRNEENKLMFISLPHKAHKQKLPRS